jgi:hypothetical protein
LETSSSNIPQSVRVGPSQKLEQLLSNPSLNELTPSQRLDNLINKQPRTSDKKRPERPERRSESSNIPQKNIDDAGSRLSDFLARGSLTNSPPRVDESVLGGRISVTRSPRSSTGDRGQSVSRTSITENVEQRSTPRSSTGERSVLRTSPPQSSSVITRRPSDSTNQGTDLLQQLRVRRRTPSLISTNEPLIPPTIHSAPESGVPESIESSDVPNSPTFAVPASISPPPPTSASGGSRTGSKLDLLIDQIEGWDVEEEDEDWSEDEPTIGFQAELHRAVKPFFTEEEQPKRNSGPPAVILFSDIPTVAPPPPPPTASPAVKSKYVNLVPLSRANNICITLSRFTRVLKANGGGDGMHATSHTLILMPVCAKLC